jgi:nicotinamidase-related amidase
MTSGDADHELYASQGIGSAIGFGERPAVVVVDYQLAFTRGALAGAFPEAELRATAEVLEAAREAGAPVVYTVCAYEADLSDAGPFGVKCPGLVACTRGTEGCDVDPLVSPAPGEPVLEKTQPSAFFGTGLAERFRELGVDTVVVCGTTTSGCVRGSVVDAMSYGFRAVVPIEAVADRSGPAHDQALFDMGHKYADVIPVAQVVAALSGTREGAARG